MTSSSFMHQTNAHFQLNYMNYVQNFSNKDINKIYRWGKAWWPKRKPDLNLTHLWAHKSITAPNPRNPLPNLPLIGMDWVGPHLNLTHCHPYCRSRTIKILWYHYSCSQMKKIFDHNSYLHLQVDAAVLQCQNQKLVQQLDAQRNEMHILEGKFKELKDKQVSYDDTLITVNKLWNQVSLSIFLFALPFCSLSPCLLIRFLPSDLVFIPS